MTRVCCSCGWLVLDGAESRQVVHRCRCGGIAVTWKAARRALGVETFRRVLEAPPDLRVRALAVRR